MRTYEDMYEPWKDSDDFNPIIIQKRLKVRAGVDANAVALGPRLERQLKDICENVNIKFFYPIVYRIDINKIPDARLDNKVGSGLRGSNEYLIRDLQEKEFDILFIDFENEPDLNSDIKKLYEEKDSMAENQVLEILERWR